MATKTAAQVISAYSTSFSLATSVLNKRARQDIRNLYAVVRIADEIVDGAVGTGREEKIRLLQAYELQVVAAPDARFHTDPILHAYADTARRCGIERQHIRAFFRSMRMDVDMAIHDQESLSEYIYGSAEVIGLMCLAIFLQGKQYNQADVASMREGAKALGAAFQKINFLRDMGEDFDALGRLYFPQLQGGHLTEAAKADIVREIREDVQVASDTIHLLPLNAQVAVRTARDLFSALVDDIEGLPASRLRLVRVSVSAPRKALIAVRAAGTTLRAGIARACRGSREGVVGGARDGVPDSAERGVPDSAERGVPDSAERGVPDSAERGVLGEVADVKNDAGLNSALVSDALTPTSPVEAEELVVLLDQQGNRIGTHPKASVHTADTPYHLAFSCYILNDRGQLLISRRALSKLAWPGVWTNSVCGHPGPGEGFADAARRRARDELGLRIDVERVVLPEFSYRAVDASGVVEWEKCPVYLAHVAPNPDGAAPNLDSVEPSVEGSVERSVGDGMAPNPDEVCDWRWVEPDKLCAAVDATPWAFSPWMVEQLEDQRLRRALMGN